MKKIKKLINISIFGLSLLTQAPTNLDKIASDSIESDSIADSIESDSITTYNATPDSITIDSITTYAHDIFSKLINKTKSETLISELESSIGDDQVKKSNSIDMLNLIRKLLDATPKDMRYIRFETLIYMIIRVNRIINNNKRNQYVSNIKAYLQESIKDIKELSIKTNTFFRH